MIKATIYAYGKSGAITYYDVTNFHIDDDLVIADYGKNKQLIFPLHSVMRIEVLNDD